MGEFGMLIDKLLEEQNLVVQGHMEMQPELNCLPLDKEEEKVELWQLGWLQQQLIIERYIK